MKIPNFDDFIKEMTLEIDKSILEVDQLINPITPKKSFRMCENIHIMDFTSHNDFVKALQLLDKKLPKLVVQLTRFPNKDRLVFQF